MAQQPMRRSALNPLKGLSPDLTGEFADIGQGRDITRPYIFDLHEPRDPRLFQSVGWGVYATIRKDDQVISCMRQRVSAVVQANWDVLPGDENDPRSVAAADAMKDMLARIGIDRITEKMLWANFYGYAVAEIEWGPHDGRHDFTRVKVKHARRFRFDKDMKLRLLTTGNVRGEICPDRKFWVVTAGADNDDEPYGEGLADWLYWPTLFKRNGVAFWNKFLDKFATPTRVATHRSNDKAEIERVTRMLHATVNGSTIAIPERFKVDLLQAARGTGDFKDMIAIMDAAISKIILSQTMTTDNGSSLAQGSVHADVKLDLVKADADLLSDSWNAGPSRWWTDQNFGEDVAAPMLVRNVEEEADLKMLAETDGALKAIGWERSDESFQDTYGDGYVRVVPATVAPVADAVPPVIDAPAVDDGAPVVSFADATPVPDDPVDAVVEAIMSEQGFKPLSPALAAIIGALEGAANIEALEASILIGLETADAEAFTQALARAGFALRLDAEVTA
jgi:phage gp29-like protein